MPQSSATQRSRAADLDDLDPYPHRPLKPGEKMRILKVQSAANIEETILCELQHKPVVESKTNTTDKRGQEFVITKFEKFSYDAVSYRWGLGSFNQSIRIFENGTYYHFQIYEHLYEALLQLRQKDRDCFLWIDSICINQNDDTERSQQVARMSEVYGDADRVCIWLGVEANGSQDAMNLIAGDLDIYDFEKQCQNEKFVHDWASFLELLKRDWFSRRWVVQEVSLAQKATIYCGSASADWEDFVVAVSLLSDMDVAAKKLSEAAKGLKSLNYPTDLFDEVSALTATTLVKTTSRLFRRSIEGQHHRVSTLEDLVARLAMFQAGEAKDYIYALLALAKDTQPYAGIPDYLEGRLLTRKQQQALFAVVRLFPSTYRQRYDINYKQDAVDVYQHFLQFALSRADPALALDIICRPFAPSTEENLPSWIPSVSDLPHAVQPDVRGGTPRMQRESGDPFVSMPDMATRYSAAGKKPLEMKKLRFKKRKTHYSMFVEGFILDIVEFGKIEPASQQGYIPLTWLQRGARQADSGALWRTLVGDRGPKGDVPGIYKNVIVPYLKPKTAGLNIDRLLRENPSSVVTDAFRHVQATIWGRCLFETSRKHLGLGPRKLQSVSRSDGRLLVCILYGCTVPIVLQEFTKNDKDIEQDKHEDNQVGTALNQPTVRKIMRRLEQKVMEKTSPPQAGVSEAHGNTESTSTENFHRDSDTYTPSQPQKVDIWQYFLAIVTGRPRNKDSVTQVGNLNRNKTYNETMANQTGKGHGAANVPLLLHQLAGLVALLFLATIMSYSFKQRLAAGLVIMFPAPHALNDIDLTHSLAVVAGTCHEHTIQCLVAGVGVSSLSSLVIYGIGYSLLHAVGLVALIDAVFMGLLPSDLARSYQAFLTRIARLSLSDIPTAYPAVRWGRRSSDSTENSKVGSDQEHDTTPSSQAGQGASESQPASSTTGPSIGVKKNVMLGDDLPYSRHYYKVIGECYVDNMMIGEAIKWQNDTVSSENRTETVTFELR